jgi:hypothetical protein
VYDLVVMQRHACLVPARRAGRPGPYVSPAAPAPPAPGAPGTGPVATTTMEHRGGQNNGNAPSSWLASLPPGAGT